MEKKNVRQKIVGVRIVAYHKALAVIENVHSRSGENLVQGLYKDIAMHTDAGSCCRTPAHEALAVDIKYYIYLIGSGFTITQTGYINVSGTGVLCHSYGMLLQYSWIGGWYLASR